MDSQWRTGTYTPTRWLWRVTLLLRHCPPSPPGYPDALSRPESPFGTQWLLRYKSEEQKILKSKPLFYLLTQSLLPCLWNMKNKNCLLPAEGSQLFWDRSIRVSKNYCFHYKYSPPALKLSASIPSIVRDYLERWLPITSSGEKFRARISQCTVAGRYHEGWSCLLMGVH